MSLSSLIIDLNNAQTPDDEKKAYAEFRERMGNEPTDAEVLTAIMRDCEDGQGNALLQADEYADLAGGKVVVKKLN